MLLAGGRGWNSMGVLLASKGRGRDCFADFVVELGSVRGRLVEATGVTFAVPAIIRIVLSTSS